MSGNNTVDYDKLEEIQIEIEEIKVNMADNIEKVISRGQNLEELSLKTQELSESSVILRTGTRQLKWKYCCNNYKQIALIILFILAILAIVIISLQPWRWHK